MGLPISRNSSSDALSKGRPASGTVSYSLFHVFLTLLSGARGLGPSQALIMAVVMLVMLAAVSFALGVAT